MSLDLNQSNDSLDDPIFNRMLVNLQANILKFHGRKFSYNLFFQFQLAPEKIAEAKQWLIYFASSKVTSADTQLYDTMVRKNDPAYDGGTVYTVSLSSYGYGHLHAQSSIAQDATFKHGMHASKDILLDDFTKWQDEFRQKQMDMLIIVADDDADVASAAAEKYNQLGGIIRQLCIKPTGQCFKNR